MTAKKILALRRKKIFKPSGDFFCRKIFCYVEKRFEKIFGSEICRKNFMSLKLPCEVKKMFQIALKIPEGVLFDTKMNLQDAEKFIRRVVALEFFKNQGVSIGYCAEIAEMTEEDFLKFLGENKISVFKFDDEAEFLSEAANA